MVPRLSFDPGSEVGTTPPRLAAFPVMVGLGFIASLFAVRENKKPVPGSVQLEWTCRTAPGAEMAGGPSVVAPLAVRSAQLVSVR